MKKTAMFLSLIWYTEVRAVEFEKLGAAVAGVLKTKSAIKASVEVGGNPQMLYYSKDDQGKPRRYAVIQKGKYEPNCSHTWVVGLNASGVVEEVRVVEMSCSHAYPTRSPAFLDQFMNKGPKNLQSLKSNVHVIAKATGSSELARDAIVRSIEAVKLFSKKSS